MGEEISWAERYVQLHRAHEKSTPEAPQIVLREFADTSVELSAMVSPHGELWIYDSKNSRPMTIGPKEARLMAEWILRMF